MPRGEWYRWSDLIGLFIATGYVKGEMAQSVLLVGEPGTGKSAILERFFKVPSTLVAMDATSDGLKKQVFPKMLAENRRHLLLPEINKLMQRRGPTSDATIGVLTLAMSGELHDSFIGENGKDRFPTDFQIGVAAAIPTKVFQEWKVVINNTGFLDRITPIDFGFSRQTLAEIQVAIATGDRSLLSPVRYPWPDRQVEIVYSAKLGGEVLKVVKKVSHQMPNRLIRLVVSLTKAACLLEGDERCKSRHVELVADFIPFLRGGTPKATYTQD